MRVHEALPVCASGGNGPHAQSARSLRRLGWWLGLGFRWLCGSHPELPPNMELVSPLRAHPTLVFLQSIDFIVLKSKVPGLCKTAP